MFRLCIVCAISFFSLCCGPLLFAQSVSSSPQFFEHLRSKKLFLEETVFIDNSLKQLDAPIARDSLNLHKTICQHILGDSAQTNNTLDAITPVPTWNKKQFHELYLSVLFVKAKHKRIEEYLSSLPANDPSVRIASHLLTIEKRQKLLLNKDDSVLFSTYPLKNFINKYNTIPKRSPFAAGLLSALVPGMGKVYAGYRIQAISAFLANTLFAAQAFEAYYKSGPKSVHFIYAAGLFGAYYVGNIAGSVWAVKKKKRDTLREIDHEISEYYSSSINAYSN